jgi:ABC-type branched-subunit amino acid transport system substrate-binding protein
MTAQTAGSTKAATAGPYLVALAATALLIATNHFYSLGPKALGLGSMVFLAPAASLTWLRRTGNRVALAGFVLTNAWVVVGFGLWKGLWRTVLPLFLGTFLSSVSTAFARPTTGPYLVEATGILIFFTSLIVLVFACRLLRWRDPRWLRPSVVVVGAGILALYTYSSRDRWVPPPGGVVHIGVIVPTSGPYAVLGNSFVRAVEMARDDLRDTRYRYELVVRDSGPDPAKAKAIIEKTIEHERLQAIVGGISLIGQVTKPYATRARIPHTCVCSVASIADGAYNFTNIPSPEAEAVRWVAEARRRGIKTMAVLTQDYPSINNHVKAMEDEARRAGLVIAFERRFGEAEADFGPMVAAAAARHPDVFYIEALNPWLDQLVERLTRAGIHNLSSVVAPSLSQRPDLFEGAWYTDSDLVDPGFKTRFEQKYPGTQFATHMMPYAYDSFRMIVEAFERGENPAVYLRNLRTYPGTADTLVKAPGSGRFDSTPAVWVMRNGRPELVR